MPLRAFAAPSQCRLIWAPRSFPEHFGSISHLFEPFLDRFEQFSNRFRTIFSFFWCHQCRGVLVVVVVAVVVVVVTVVVIVLVVVVVVAMPRRQYDIPLANVRFFRDELQ